MNAILVSTLRAMLNAGDPVDIKLWVKSGEMSCKPNAEDELVRIMLRCCRHCVNEIQEWRNCIPLRYNFYKGTQQFKLLNSNQPSARQSLRL